MTSDATFTTSRQCTWRAGINHAFGTANVKAGAAASQGDAVGSIEADAPVVGGLSR